jgi:hypothetical protein
VQLAKLAEHRVEIQDRAQIQDETNNEHLDKIDKVYLETQSLEAQFISKKMDNSNLITEFETNGLKFLHQFNQTSRETESINS